MAKKGMKRFYPRHRKNDEPPVPEIQGKAKSGKKRARPMIPEAMGKVFHDTPHPIPSAFSAIDNDLAVENIENDFDMTAADLQDFHE